jgi:hypothetical protein
MGAAARAVAVLAGLQQRLGADQAAHMRRQDALLASLHGVGPASDEWRTPCVHDPHYGMFLWERYTMAPRLSLDGKSLLPR